MSLRQPPKQITVDESIKQGFRKFKELSTVNKAAAIFMSAYSMIPPFKEAVSEVIAQGSVKGYHASMDAARAAAPYVVEAVDFIGEAVPLPHGIPSPRSLPFGEAPVLTAVAASFYPGPVVHVGSAGSTGPMGSDVTVHIQPIALRVVQKQVYAYGENNLAQQQAVKKFNPAVFGGDEAAS